MQFPHSSFIPLIYSIGIPTFSDVVETPPDQIACEMWGRWCRCCPWAPQPGPVGQAARLCETPVAFAGTGRASTETGIAFAGEKWAVLVQFSGAEVMVVSMVAVQRRALVMMVSRWPASVAAEVSLVSTSPRGCVCARKSSPCVAWWWVSARKSSPFVFIMAQNWCFRACRANFFAEMPLEARCRASFFADRQ